MANPRWLLLAISFALLSGHAKADRRDTAPLTEDIVVASALRRAPLREVIDGLVATERGRALTAKTRPLPQVTYLREQTYGAAGTGEDYLSVAQTIRLGHRPRVVAAASAARIDAARSEGDAIEIDVAADARERFYDVLHRQLRAAALRSWIGRIDEMLAIVARREQRGDAALYDRRRLERERQVASARLESELATAERAAGRLAALVEVSDDGAEVVGTLLPDLDPQELPELRARSSARPDLRALGFHAVAARHDRDALSRAWLPDLRLEAGWKGVGMPGQGRADGFMLAAMLSLHPRNLAAGNRRIAEAGARTVEGQRALAITELDRELRGARAEVVRLRRAAVEFRAQAVETSADLVRIASVGYEGGELGLLEVLDAYRGSADDALGVLDMEHAARHARIQLDRVTAMEGR